MRKISQLFSRNPADAIERAASQLATVETEISSLQAEREAALLNYVGTHVCSVNS